MTRKPNVFASNGERRAFKQIEKTIAPQWKVYPNLPLTALVDADKGDFKGGEWEYYLKGTVDFVITQPDDSISFAVEFDGLGGGFSSGRRYKQKDSCNDEFRALKLDFKMQLCEKVRIPLVVMSFDEIAVLPDTDRLTILNSIVGQFIGNEEFKHERETWERSGEVCRSWWDHELKMIDLQIAAEWANDPFRRLTEPYWVKLKRLGLRVSLETVTVPSILEQLRTRKPFESLGAKMTISHPSGKLIVQRTVMVRNFAGMELSPILDSSLPTNIGFNPLRVAESIVAFLAPKAAIEVIELVP